MVLPEEVEKPVVPELPKESAEKKDDESKVDGEPSKVEGEPPKVEDEPVLSNVEIKKKIVQAEDEELKSRLAHRLRFRTSSQNTSTLGEYIQRMVDEQTDIYYMVGRTPQQLARSPFVRRFVKAGLEVIYMIDPILDELTIKKMGRRYDNFRLVSVNSETIELPEFSNQKFDRIKRKREALDEFLPLCKRLKSVYSHEIHKIVISDTLVESSCAMVPSHEIPDEEDEPSYTVNAEWGRIRLEINPDSDSLRLLCLQARLLEKKQDQFDDLVKFLFGPATAEDSLVIEQPCSPFSDDSCSELSEIY